ncbi:hypothetical protein ACJBSH_00740 [Streptococcus suis]|uniref:Uncharacterized protein n=1 Tax=Streptococcus suis TaxID=1307 RepID=A0A1X9I1W3_STRSU|nr:hypothetical protein [Streptococcus suis]AER15042.1 hypothetical protein SSU12_0859 [Streptococcus suis SS12]ANJ64230.1 hypothetical protein [Streptococcus suis]MBP0925840.1 hypothetical protein [Streptococcus suis]MBS0800491.1 hypothetical protein [Streptococcus suis]MCH1652010.1 hypothetical protein [Streptococcus suis]
MKKFLKHLIVVSLLGGFVLSIDRGSTINLKTMNGIDPGPANIYMK